LEYDRFTRAQQKSSFLAAAREELKQNIARLRKLNERLPGKDDKQYSVIDSEWPQLRLFIWQGASHPPSFFDIRTQILIDMYTFYADIDLMLSDGEARDWFRHLLTSNVYDRTQFKERLVAQLTLAETSIVQELDNEIAEAEQLTKKYSTPD
jgi:hypothetical protein